MTAMMAQLRLCGILPCIQATTEAQLYAAAKELNSLGFPCIQVDLTGEQPEACVWSSVLALDGLAVGAKISTWGQAIRALEAGAGWVSLPLREALLDREQWDKVIFCVESPEELQILGEAGQQISIPQEALFACPPHSAQSLREAFPQAGLVISGCGDAMECRNWLATPGVLAVSCFMESLEQKVVQDARRLHRLWAQTLDFSLAHIGINPQAPEDAAKTALAFAKLLGMTYMPGEASDYAGTIIEAMKEKGRGRHGHIGIGTGDLTRGMFYAQRAGFAFDMTSRKNDPAGRAILYYLEEEIGGFAVHLLQK